MGYTFSMLIQVLLITIMVSKNGKHLLRKGRFIRLTRRRLLAKLYELLRKSEPELHLESAGIVTVGCVRRYSWIRGRSKEQYISTINPITRRQATRVKYVAGVLAEVTSIHLRKV